MMGYCQLSDIIGMLTMTAILPWAETVVAARARMKSLENMFAVGGLSEIGLVNRL
jgi:hypothetical protein